MEITPELHKAVNEGVLKLLTQPEYNNVWILEVLYDSVPFDLITAEMVETAGNLIRAKLAEIALAHMPELTGDSCAESVCL